MTLRTKFLALFLFLGVLPLLGLGAWSYVQSTRALEDLLATRTLAIARRAAAAVAHRYALSISDLQFLADNAETQRLLAAGAGSGGGLPDSDRLQVESFLDDAWETVGLSWRWAELRSSSGELTYRLGTAARGTIFDQEGGPVGGPTELLVTRPILDLERGTYVEIGTVRGSLPLQEVLPRSELAAGFGEAGYSVVIDRDRGEVLYHPRRVALRQTLPSLLGRGGWDLGPEPFSAPEGAFSYSERGVDRVASFVSLADPPWTVVSSESLQEFVAPFARTGLFSLLVVLLVTATISVAFILLTRRATDSLARLTDAADKVAGGNFDPPLPPGGSDEVGRLSSAFGMMVGQVQATLRRIEESRHMSAIGEFTAQLSHEIRNPLTSIKLNLQRLHRGVEGSRIPREYAGAVRICLREVKRLDGTVRGVLSMVRTRPLRRDPVSVHAVIRAALEVLTPQLEDQAMGVDAEMAARDDTVLGDREQLEGAFLNLFLNAAEATSEGGTLRVATASGGAVDSGPGTEDGSAPIGREIRVEVTDDGPGVPEELRDRIFDPFFTAKEGGTGFGLPLAARVMEEHSGTLTLRPADASKPGATFEIVLPLAQVEADQR